MSESEASMPSRTDLNLASRLVIKRRIPTFNPCSTLLSFGACNHKVQTKKLPLTAPMLLLDNTTAISGSDPTIE